ncbi:MAG TPA: hypothetical protein VGN17_27745 [Bryobacteraceae bacterium]|jgi:hypothetical protein
MTEALPGPAPLAKQVKILLGIWFVILVPWLPVFTLIGTAGAFDDANGRWDLYRYLAVAWTYPLLVGVAYFFRRRKPELCWLPMAPAILMLLRAAGAG